jgi:threonine/homoserine/homoserine lactone efflux protein
MIDALFAFDPALLATFIVAGLLLNLTPGADFLFISATAINSGARVGMAGAIGVNLGVAVHLVAAVLGVSALLIAFPWTYDAIRIGGAIYLIFLGHRAWTDRSDLGEGRAAVGKLTALRRGFLTNVLNPKTALFIFAFIPQFADPSTGLVPIQIGVLGLIFMANGFIFSMSLAGLAGAFSRILAKRVRLLNKITAIMFGGLAARLLID